MRLLVLSSLLPLFLALSCHGQNKHGKDAPSFVDGNGEVITRLELTPEQWQKRLNEQEFEVLRRQGTEMAFTGEYWGSHKQGIYTCAGCGLPLFESDSKFNSGTGWPSFYQPIDETHIEPASASGFGMFGIEVHCNKCRGHLGHVFDDGPQPTGLRYCINSVSLDFEEAR